MPYAVWIEVSDPDPGTTAEVAQTQRPKLIMELIRAGWETPAIDDDREDDEEVRRGSCHSPAPHSSGLQPSPAARRHLDLRYRYALSRADTRRHASQQAEDVGSFSGRRLAYGQAGRVAWTVGQQGVQQRQPDSCRVRA